MFRLETFSPGGCVQIHRASLPLREYASKHSFGEKDMNITVSAEAVETAVEIALSGLDDIVKKISSQEKPFQDISKPAQDLVKKSMVDFKNKDYTEAVLKLQEVIRLEPQYNRGKLQLMNIHKRMGYDYVVAFSGGIVYERAKDKYTKMQAASIVGEVCHAAYKTKSLSGKITLDCIAF
jgi:hypothetical protein